MRYNTVISQRRGERKALFHRLKRLRAGSPLLVFWLALLHAAVLGLLVWKLCAGRWGHAGLCLLTLLLFQAPPLTEALTKLRVPPLLEAARRGIHVLVEKPLCTTLEEADTLLDLSKRTGSRICVAHLARYSILFRTMKRHRRYCHLINRKRRMKAYGKDLHLH